MNIQSRRSINIYFLAIILLILSAILFFSCSKDNPKPQPAITHFIPDTGSTGTTVIISVSNFALTSSGNMVAFDGFNAEVIQVSDTTITAVVPADALSGPITIINANKQDVASTKDFTVTTGDQ